jgi:hypothetical protein
VAVWRRADQSLRLRLHSGLRQSGRSSTRRSYGTAEARPFQLLVWVKWAGAVALSRDAHLSYDEAVAKMGHPELGHPPSPPSEASRRPSTTTR